MSLSRSLGAPSPKLEQPLLSQEPRLRPSVDSRVSSALKGHQLSPCCLPGAVLGTVGAESNSTRALWGWWAQGREQTHREMATRRLGTPSSPLSARIST